MYSQAAIHLCEYGVCYSIVVFGIAARNLRSPAFVTRLPLSLSNRRDENEIERISSIVHLLVLADTLLFRNCKTHNSHPALVSTLFCSVHTDKSVDRQ